uniref:Uncharacterized protein n=1 Tax=Setaria viridis TaxID=4556 RepID=A0A4U6TDB6_SETVI|nr:hypothetical protein SEVIR_8G008525v2 [Setaria viridis]
MRNFIIWVSIREREGELKLASHLQALSQKFPTPLFCTLTVYFYSLESQKAKHR